MKTNRNALWYGVWIFFSVWIGLFNSPAMAAIDLGSPNPVNLTFSILLGAAIGIGLFFFFFWLRQRAFTRSVKQDRMSPKKAFDKYWGKGPKITVYGISIFLGILVAGYSFWSLGG